MVPEMGFEPTSPKAADFESAMYTVPSLWQIFNYWNDSHILLKSK